MSTVGLCVIKKSAKTAKLDNVFEHIFTPRIYQVSDVIIMQLRRFVALSAAQIMTNVDSIVYEILVALNGQC